jgi:glycosyltransferase involved in cell wall biosynthesis
MKTASLPLVSIVTPVYNESKHLAECIESVLAQTYQNWDYTIVDNCSTDDSVEIARRYAAKDRRIRIHENREFLEVIANHNVAIRQLSPASMYCKVVLGDDWIFPECLEQMVAVAEDHPSVGMVSAYCLQGTQVMWTGLPYERTVIPGREVCRRHLLEELYLSGSATSVLYRADAVRALNPFYNEAHIHGDTEVCFAILKTYSLGFVHQVLTFTRVRPGSLTTIASNRSSYFPGTLHILMMYGPEYLTREEFNDCLNQHLAQYYRFLGKNLLLRRDKDFWDYHRKQLSEAGIGLSRSRVARAALANLCTAAVNPKDTLEKLLQHKGKRNLADRQQNRAPIPAIVPRQGGPQAEDAKLGREPKPRTFR